MRSTAKTESARSISDLRTLSGVQDSVSEPTRDPTVWLILIGLVLLILDAFFDTGIALRRRP